MVVVVVCLAVLSSGLAPAPSAPSAEAARLPQGLAFSPNGAIFDEAVRLNGFAGRVEVQPTPMGRSSACG